MQGMSGRMSLTLHLPQLPHWYIATFSHLRPNCSALPPQPLLCVVMVSMWGESCGGVLDTPPLFLDRPGSMGLGSFMQSLHIGDSFAPSALTTSPVVT